MTNKIVGTVILVFGLLFGGVTVLAASSDNAEKPKMVFKYSAEQWENTQSRNEILGSAIASHGLIDPVILGRNTYKFIVSTGRANLLAEKYHGNPEAYERDFLLLNGFPSENPPKLTIEQFRSISLNGGFIALLNQNPATFPQRDWRQFAGPTAVTDTVLAEQSQTVEQRQQVIINPPQPPVMVAEVGKSDAKVSPTITVKATPEKTVSIGNGDAPIGQALNSLNERVQALENRRVNDQSQAVASLRAELARVKTQLKAASSNKEVAGLEAKVSNLNNQLNKLDGKVGSLATDVSSFKEVLALFSKALASLNSDFQAFMENPVDLSEVSTLKALGVIAVVLTLLSVWFLSRRVKKGEKKTFQSMEKLSQEVSGFTNTRDDYQVEGVFSTFANEQMKVGESRRFTVKIGGQSFLCAIKRLDNLNYSIQGIVRSVESKTNECTIRNDVNISSFIEKAVKGNRVRGLDWKPA